MDDKQLLEAAARAAGDRPKSIFAGDCWRCWPKFCKCPPSETELECMRGEIFLLDQELQRENRRAREFAEALRDLASAVWKVRESRIEADGLDGLPADLFKLGEQVQQAANLLAEPRNEDRVSALYRRLEGRAAAAQEDA